jgi:tRNA modification GTPase
MEFVHDPYQPGQTIAAIATPPGEGGVAIVRISGNEALACAAKIFSGPVLTYKTHTAHYGHIHNAEGQLVDSVLLLVMLGRRSFTGEDTVEIHCHGGGLIARRVLDVVLHAGVRAAMPGEFSFKAFVNGKIDLAQAEAIQSLIGAKNEKALDAATNQLQGQLSAKVTAFQVELTHIAAILEAWVDFPEEGIEFASMDDVATVLLRISTALEELIATYHDGKIARDGISLCLVGSPNVGKSSLMNALLDKERAIVSPTPGTTRDIVEDSLRINGLNFTLIDTAGIRHAQDLVEQEGIRRSRLAMNRADLVLLVLDASVGMTAEEESLLLEVPKECSIIVWNKVDLPHASLPEVPFPHVVVLSAKEKLGFKDLHSAIDEVIWKRGPPSREEILIANVRHKEALQNSVTALKRVHEGLVLGVSPEFLAFDMRQCLLELGKILGTNVGEDILSSIFSQFCIGK